MKNISELINKTKRKETIIQFGEGVFLRGFFDCMVNRMNNETVYNGSAVIVQPRESGICHKLTRQNCIYTHLMRGIKNGKPSEEKEIIECISRCINPYTNFSDFLSLAENPDLRIIVSNTTEAGIVYAEEDKFTDAPPRSFPAKLTILLYYRFKAGLKGFIILPCELIENNGKTLREIILKYIDKWNLGEEFINWVNKENIFNNTLVDRIVTGYPKDEINHLKLGLGYEDIMLNTSEPYYLWVIEGDINQSEELPFAKANLNVVWTDDLKPYRTRKVRILNGAHTSMVCAGLLCGHETVRDCIDDNVFFSFLNKIIFNEILPTLDLPQQELITYANDVLERFANPYIKHFLLSIALNSVSKFKVRVLPTILEYFKRTGKTPDLLTFSLASMIAFYKTNVANDDAGIIEFMAKASPEEILSNTKLWDADLTFLLQDVNRHLQNIKIKGIKAAIGELL